MKRDNDDLGLVARLAVAAGPVLWLLILTLPMLAWAVYKLAAAANMLTIAGR